MDIQELLQFIYLLIFTVGAVFIAFLCVDFKVCHECTRTWWGLHFMLNSKYWAMSILYWRYHEKKAEGIKLISSKYYYICELNIASDYD